MVVHTRSLNKTNEGAMLERLRVLERKMGLVLTLVRTLPTLDVRVLPTLRDYSSRRLSGAL